MTQYDPREHDRHSIRLRGYDYSLAGMYFVTVCTNSRLPLFGEIDEGKMMGRPSAAMVWSIWDTIPSRFADVDLYAFMIMPNHLHGIIVLKNRPVGAGIVPAEDTPGRKRPRQQKCTLGDVMCDLKSRTSDAYRAGVKHEGWQRYDRRLWQRGYFEHIIRDGAALERTRKYIENNPARWSLDRENPGRTGDDEFDLWLDSFGDQWRVADGEREGAGNSDIG